MADEYIAGYLAWRPQTGTGLGFHQYDGKVTDYSQPSLDAELARLKSFDRRLGQFNTNRLSPQAFYDYRILRSCHPARDLRVRADADLLATIPMTYAGALDVNIYIKRNFAPLEDRVRSIIAILNQAPQIIRRRGRTWPNPCRARRWRRPSRRRGNRGFPEQGPGGGAEGREG